MKGDASDQIVASQHDIKMMRIDSRQVGQKIITKKIGPEDFYTMQKHEFIFYA